MYKEDIIILWDNIKYDIKKYSIECSNLIQRVKGMKERKVRKDLKEELSKERSNLQKKIMLAEKLSEIEE